MLLLYYSRNSNIKIEFFDDRCELISHGGFYDGLTLESALKCVQTFSRGLVRLFNHLNLFHKKNCLIYEVKYKKTLENTFMKIPLYFYAHLEYNTYLLNRAEGGGFMVRNNKKSLVRRFFDKLVAFLVYGENYNSTMF